MKKILLLGYGYTARRLAVRLAAHGWTASGTYRDAAKAGTLAADGVAPFLWTGAGVDPAAFEGADAILVSTPPDDAGCPAFAAAHEALSKRNPGWIGYLSTNGVYGDHGGAWIDETSPLLGTTQRAKNRIRAEEQWKSFARDHLLRLTIFRLPGIYGPGRSALDAVREGRAQRIFKAGQVFSRAHVDDIAAALHASLDNPAAGDLFNIADDEPAPPQDVIEFACGLLGVAPLPLIPIDDAALSEMARSFYADNKRVSNARMKAQLLPALKYPTYREGLRAILSGEPSATGIRG